MKPHDLPLRQARDKVTYDSRYPLRLSIRFLQIAAECVWEYISRRAAVETCL